MVTPLNLTLFHQDKRYGNSQGPTVPKYYGTFVNEKCTDLFPNEKPVGVNDTWNKVKTTLYMVQTKFLVGIEVVEFSMLKPGGAIIIWINTSKKSRDYGNC